MKESSQAVHIKIEKEVNKEKERLGNFEESFIFKGIERVLNGILPDPDTRSRGQMIEYIAALEYLASNMRDEVADEQYRDPTPEEAK